MHNEAVKSLLSVTEVDANSGLIFTVNGAYITVSKREYCDSDEDPGGKLMRTLQTFPCPAFVQSCERIMGLKVAHVPNVSEFTTLDLEHQSSSDESSCGLHLQRSIIVLYGGRTMSIYGFIYSPEFFTTSFYHVGSFTATQAILDAIPIVSRALAFDEHLSAPYIMLSVPIALASASVQLLHVAFPTQALHALTSPTGTSYHNVTSLSRADVYASLTQHTFASMPSLLYHATLHIDRLPTTSHGLPSTDISSLYSILSRTTLTAGSAMGTLLHATPFAHLYPAHTTDLTLPLAQHPFSFGQPCIHGDTATAEGCTMSTSFSSTGVSRRCRPLWQTLSRTHAPHTRLGTPSTLLSASSCPTVASTLDTSLSRTFLLLSPATIAETGENECFPGTVDAPALVDAAENGQAMAVQAPGAARGSETLKLFPWHVLCAAAASIPGRPHPHTSMCLPLVLFAPFIAALARISSSSSPSSPSSCSSPSSVLASLSPAPWAATTSTFDAVSSPGPRGSILHLSHAPALTLQVTPPAPTLGGGKSVGAGAPTHTHAAGLQVTTPLPLVVTASDDRAISVWTLSSAGMPSTCDSRSPALDSAPTLPASCSSAAAATWTSVWSAPMHSARPFRVRCLTPRVHSVRARLDSACAGLMYVDARVCVPVISAGEDRVVRLTRVVVDITITLPQTNLNSGGSQPISENPRSAHMCPGDNAASACVRVRAVHVREVGGVLHTQGHVWALGELPRRPRTNASIEPTSSTLAASLPASRGGSDAVVAGDEAAIVAASDEFAECDRGTILVGDAGGGWYAIPLADAYLCDEDDPDEMKVLSVGCAVETGPVGIELIATDNISAASAAPHLAVDTTDSDGRNTAVQAQGKDAARKHVAAQVAAPAVAARAAAEEGKVVCADGDGGWLCTVTTVKAMDKDGASANSGRNGGAMLPCVRILRYEDGGAAEQLDATPTDVSVRALMLQARGMRVHAVDAQSALVCVWTSRGQLLLCRVNTTVASFAYTSPSACMLQCSAWVTSGATPHASIAAVSFIDNPPAALLALAHRAATLPALHGSDLAHTCPTVTHADTDLSRARLLCVVDVRGLVTLSLVEVRATGPLCVPLASMQLAVGAGMALSVAMLPTAEKAVRHSSICADVDSAGRCTHQSAYCGVCGPLSARFTLLTGTNKGYLTVSVCEWVVTPVSTIAACHSSDAASATNVASCSTSCRILRSITLDDQLNSLTDLRATQEATSQGKGKPTTSPGSHPILQLLSASPTSAYCLAKDMPLRLLTVSVTTPLADGDASVVDVNTPTSSTATGLGESSCISVCVDASWPLPAGYQPERVWSARHTATAHATNSSPIGGGDVYRSSPQHLPSLVSAGFTDAAFLLYDLASATTLASLPLLTPRKHAWAVCLVPSSTLRGNSKDTHNSDVVIDKDAHAMTACSPTGAWTSWALATTAPLPPHTRGITRVSTAATVTQGSSRVTVFTPTTPPASVLATPTHARLITHVASRLVPAPSLTGDATAMLPYVATSSDDGSVTGYVLVRNKQARWAWSQRQWPVRVTDDTVKAIVWPSPYGGTDEVLTGGRCMPDCTVIGDTGAWALACGGKGQLCVVSTNDSVVESRDITSGRDRNDCHDNYETVEDKPCAVPTQEYTAHRPWSVRARYTQVAPGAQPRLLCVSACVLPQSLVGLTVAATGSSMGAVEVLLISNPPVVAGIRTSSASAVNGPSAQTSLRNIPSITSVALSHLHAAPVLHARLMPLPAYLAGDLQQPSMLLVTACSRGRVRVWLVEVDASGGATGMSSDDSIVTHEQYSSPHLLERKRKASTSPERERPLRDSEKLSFAMINDVSEEPLTSLTHDTSPGTNTVAGWVPSCRLTPLLCLPVHAAGVCSLDVILMPEQNNLAVDSTMAAAAAEGHSPTTPAVTLCVVTGGDDATVAFTRVALRKSPHKCSVVDAPSTLCGVSASLCDIQRERKAHVAAVKAVVILRATRQRDPAICPAFESSPVPTDVTAGVLPCDTTAIVLTVGSDQRVCTWRWPTTVTQLPSVAEYASSTPVHDTQKEQAAHDVTARLVREDHTAVSDVETACASAAGLIVGGKGMELLALAHFKDGKVNM